MRSFRCDVCGGPLYFENSLCLTCGSAVGYSRADHRVRVLDDDPVCASATLNGCNWIVERAGALCFSCSLTRIRPADEDAVGLAQYQRAEEAKRRLVFQLDDLRLPLTTRAQDPERGIAFDLLSSADTPVTTGHADGVITIDLAESDDAYRERLRVELGEPYRTMLGHLRHEVGHYYETVLVLDDASPWLGRVRDLFGDDTTSYADEIDRHYREGSPDGWADAFVSEYATMHPYEDFAECFAHVLHIRDTVQTAGAFGLTAAVDADAVDFRSLVTAVWLPLSYALNQVDRSMGQDDLYPFVLAPRVLDKLALVGEIVAATGSVERAES
ncbi:zinc-binding metallopeptidase family protein [Mumia qirimensis]|uniref:zinc-binding metallopeptidase family protein n=1 Tax=Mumia qirimensis TaxID=3234852 RepID=UPI00351D08D3